MDIYLYFVAAMLILVGLIGVIVPLLPGIPMIFGGVWLIAWLDQYQHLGLRWVIAIAVVGVGGMVLDVLAAALSAKRFGASRRAIWGALIGSLGGVFFGLPGVLFGPLLGAVTGELASGSSALRAADVGANAWLGLVFGTVAKLVASVIMLALLAAGWWWNRSALV